MMEAEMVTDIIYGYVTTGYLTTSQVVMESPVDHMTSSAPQVGDTNFEVERDIIFGSFLNVIYGALFAVVVVPALVGNVLVILTYFRFTHMRTSVNTYIVNLAFCDLLLITLECQPIVIQYVLPSKWSRYVVTDISCTIFFFFNTFFGTAAIMTLFALSVERFCCVIHPVTTMAFATNTGTRAKFILVLVWCTALLPHFGNCVLFDSVKREIHISEHGQYVYDVTFCVSKKADDNLFYGSFYAATVFILLYASTFFTTLSIYMKIIWKLKKRKIDRFQNGSQVHVRSRSRRGSAHEKALRRTIKLFWISVLSYTVFYSLYFYVNFYYVYFGLYKRQGFTMVLIANWFGALNACINPFLHAVFVSKFRRSIGMLLRCRGEGSARASPDGNPPSGQHDAVGENQSGNVSNTAEPGIPLEPVTRHTGNHLVL